MAYLPGLDSWLGPLNAPAQQRGLLGQPWIMDRIWTRQWEPTGSSLTLGGLNYDSEIRLLVQKYMRDGVFWNISRSFFFTHTL